MIADELRPGDTFVCHSQIEWAEMSNRERKEAQRAVLDRRVGSCLTYDRIHLRVQTGKGTSTWCIPKVAPVVLLTVEKPKSNHRAFAKRTPRKAA